MAFPTTGLLDNFNRADENPLAGNWSTPMVSGSNSSQLNGNAYTGIGSTNAWWNAATFGPDCECYVTITTLPASGFGPVNVWARVSSPGTAGFDGYVVHLYDDDVLAQWVLRIARWDDGSQTVISDTNPGAITAGDKLGIEVAGSQINAYIFRSGAWSLIKSETDTTYSSAGFIGIGMDSAAAVLDDFSGGTTTAAPVSSAYRVTTSPLRW